MGSIQQISIIGAVSMFVHIFQMHIFVNIYKNKRLICLSFQYTVYISNSLNKYFD